MLAQNELFRTHALGSFTTLVRDDHAGPGDAPVPHRIENRKGAINENYARELMELFTLGADRGAYTENDVRELARALTGWRADWSRRLGFHNFRFDTRTARTPATRRCSARPATSTGRTPAGSSSSTRCTPRSSSRSCGPTSSRGRPTAADAPRSRQLYVEPGYRSGPSSRRSSAPRLLHGPADGQAAGRLIAGLLRATARGDRRRAPGSGSADGAGPAALLPAERRGLERPRWLDTQHDARRAGSVAYELGATREHPAGGDRLRADETPEQALAAARAFWGDPRSPPRRAPRCSRSPSRVAGHEQRTR